MHQTHIKIVQNYLAKHVIVIRAHVCPSYMSAQYCTNTSVVSGVYQNKKHQFYFRYLLMCMSCSLSF